MKIRKFKIDVYDWNVILIETEKSKDFKRTKKYFKEFRIPKREIRKIEQQINMINGGEHFYNLKARHSLIFLYKQESIKTRMRILCHEKRHLEDRILNHCGIDDMEASAYLAGFLAEKLL